MVLRPAQTGILPSSRFQPGTLRKFGSLKTMDSQLMTTKPDVLAQQLCLLDHYLMARMKPAEILTAIWRSSMTEEEKAEELPQLLQFVDRFNTVDPLDVCY